MREAGRGESQLDVGSAAVNDTPGLTGRSGG